jgi:hypothetical protein
MSKQIIGGAAISMPGDKKALPGLGDGKKSSKPPPAPDFLGLAREQGAQARSLLDAQTRANRPDISTPWASENWNQDANGNWKLNTSLNGQLGGASDALQSQVANMAANPFDFSQFGTMGNGDAARQQAIDASYNQATSRLDPQWAQREDQTRTQLMNQGLTPGTEAWNQSMSGLGRDRNDAYSSAMNGAILGGTAAGDSAFRNNLSARQQAIQEALMGRALPFQEMQQLQGMTGLPGFNSAGVGQADNVFGAAQTQDARDMQAWQQQQQSRNQLISSLLGLANPVGMVLGGVLGKRGPPDASQQEQDQGPSYSNAPVPMTYTGSWP